MKSAINVEKHFLLHFVFRPKIWQFFKIFNFQALKTHLLQIAMILIFSAPNSYIIYISH